MISLFKECCVTDIIVKFSNTTKFVFNVGICLTSANLKFVIILNENNDVYGGKKITRNVSVITT